MRDCRLLIGALICIGVLFGSGVSAQERITLSAKLSEPADGFANVVVSFEIEEGWHAYAQTDIGQVMEATLKLPDDITPAGRWEKPEGLPYEGDVLVYEGEGTFSRRLSISDSDAARQIVVTVAYQVCNDTGCMAPDEIQFELSVPASAPTPPEEKAGLSFDNEHFSAPELLMAGGERLNNTTGQIYVSPTLHDIDNDGAIELVIGDVAGKIRVYENENDDQDGQPVWADAGFLRTTEGDDTIAKNW